MSVLVFHKDWSFCEKKATKEKRMKQRLFDTRITYKMAFFIFCPTCANERSGTTTPSFNKSHIFAATFVEAVRTGAMKAFRLNFVVLGRMTPYPRAWTSQFRILFTVDKDNVNAKSIRTRGNPFLARNVDGI